jgi:hypothetical protein
MRFLARQVATTATQKRLAFQRTPHGPLVTVLSGHAFLEQFTQQPRNAGIPPRRLNAGPLGNVFFEGDGYIPKLGFGGHENSVTRNQCVSPQRPSGDSSARLSSAKPAIGWIANSTPIIQLVGECREQKDDKFLELG